LIFQIEQGGLLPALDRDPADVITGSERTVRAYADRLSLAATAIVVLIKPAFKTPDEVDTDMLKCFQVALDSGDLQAWNFAKKRVQ
jgi:hypothetical protein